MRTHPPSTQPPSRGRVRLAALLSAGGSGLLMAACTGGSAAHSTAGTPVGASSAGPTRAACPVGSWSVAAADEFAQMGLDTLTHGSVRTIAGTVRVTFDASGRYAFAYDGVKLSLGDGSGTAAVSGPASGTWSLTGDRLTTRVTTSTVSVEVQVAGVRVSPSDALNQALRGGLPSTARVRCTGGRLVTTVTTGAAAGREVTFSAG